MTDRLLSVGNDFTLRPAVKVLDGNLPARLSAAALNAAYPDAAATATALGGKVGKGDLSYNATDYPNAAAAVAAAYADGRSLHWPNGAYPSTGTIPNLHKVRHTGNGRITRDGITFYPSPTYAQTNTLYADPAGSTTNDGLTPGAPMKLLSNAFSAFTNYGPVLQGNWIVRLAAGTYNDQAITGQQSINRIWIYGPTVAAGVTPTAIFDPGTTGFTKAIGGSDYLNIGIKDVKVQNYLTAEVPAIDFATHCDIWYSNVWASGNDIGFRVMNHTKYRMDGCVSENNTQYGIMELFSVVRDFKTGGATANPTYLRGNGKVGIKAKELCTGHLDGAIIYDNMHGIHFSRSCTGNGTSTKIYRNQYGVTLRNQSSFVPLSVDWKFGTADINTVTPWDVEGSSSFVSNENEATVGKFSGRGEKLLGSFAPDPAYSLTGSTVATTVTSFGNLRQGSLARAGGYVKLVVIGSKGGTAGTATVDFRFGGSTAGTIVIPANTPAAFKIEYTIFSRGPGKQTVYSSTDAVPAVASQRVDRTYDVTLSDYLMGLRATLANAGDSLTINAAWCYTTEALADE